MSLIDDTTGVPVKHQRDRARTSDMYWAISDLVFFKTCASSTMTRPKTASSSGWSVNSMLALLKHECGAITTLCCMTAILSMKRGLGTAVIIPSAPVL